MLRIRPTRLLHPQERNIAMMAKFLELMRIQRKLPAKIKTSSRYLPPISEQRFCSTCSLSQRFHHCIRKTNIKAKNETKTVSRQDCCIMADKHVPSWCTREQVAKPTEESTIDRIISSFSTRFILAVTEIDGALTLSLESR